MIKILKSIFIILAILTGCPGGKAMSAIDYSLDFSDPTVRELVKAITAGDTNTVKRLANEGVNLNAVGEYENTPLRVAVKLKRKQIVRLLFELGVSPNLRTPKGTVAAADDAVIEKDLDFLGLFLQFKLDPNLYCHDVPLIFFAVSESNWPHYEMLLAKGADINSKAANGRTLLLELVMQMEYDRAKELMLRGADFRPVSEQGLNVLEELVDYQRRLCNGPNLTDCRKRAEILRLIKERGGTVPAGLPYM